MNDTLRNGTILMMGATVFSAGVFVIVHSLV